MPRRVLLGSVALAFLAGCDSHAYYDEAQTCVSEARQVLIDARWCQAQIEKQIPCSTNDLVKFEAGAWRMGHLTHDGVYIHIYQVDDPAIAQKIIDRVREKHKSIPNVAVRVFVYGSK